MRRAIFAYNHADWYVDSVLLRATRIKQMPDDLVSSLTGLTEARFPVAARARYADDLSELEAEQRFQRGENAAQRRRGLDHPPRHRHLRPRGLAGRRGQRRRDQEDRPQLPSSAATSSSRTSTATASPTRTSARSRRATRCRSRTRATRAARPGDPGERRRSRPARRRPAASSTPPTRSRATRRQDERSAAHRARRSR